MAASVSKKISIFTKAEEGSLILFSLFLFVLMALMGGIAIDFIKYETVRSQVSQSLDRCTLMAASLDQRLDPQSVVEDCMTKAGLGDKLQNITVVDGANGRDVRASVSADTNPFFMHMIGIESFDAKAQSRAEQKITNVELSLVLDVSGSMAGAKINNLKAAASDFVETMLENDTGGRTAIALVPYNGQVNLGSALRSQFNATDNHNVADVNCLDLPASVYSSSAMSRTMPMPMTAHADSFSTTIQANGYVWFNDAWATPHPLNRWCPPSTTNTVRMPTNDLVQLQSNINGLTAIGATSINAGMKWGLTMLDPSSRGLFDDMVNAGQMPGDLGARPYDYGTEETMKVIVLMTDGAHFAEERINDGFRMGLSPIHRANNTGEYSIHHPGRVGLAKFYVPHLNIWQMTAFSSGSGTTPQTWEHVWANQRVSWVAWQLYARAFAADGANAAAAYNAAMNLLRTRTNTTAMDAQLQQACDLAKANDVTVYGIAFEAPAAGQAQILQCSSSNQHYFNAQGLSIATAFESIANNLTMLKLTQ